MDHSKSRREVLVGGAVGALFAALSPSVLAGEIAFSPVQGGTNPVVKVPPELEGRTGSSLRITVYPSTMDKPGDQYQLRILELRVRKNGEGQFIVDVLESGIEGLDGKEFVTTLTVADLATPMIGVAKLAYIPDNVAARVLVAVAFNGARSGITPVQIKKV